MRLLSDVAIAIVSALTQCSGFQNSNRRAELQTGDFRYTDRVTFENDAPNQWRLPRGASGEDLL